MPQFEPFFCVSKFKSPIKSLKNISQEIISHDVFFKCFQLVFRSLFAQRKFHDFLSRIVSCFLIPPFVMTPKTNINLVNKAWRMETCVGRMFMTIRKEEMKMKSFFVARTSQLVQSMSQQISLWIFLLLFVSRQPRRREDYKQQVREGWIFVLSPQQAIES
jgi:hypothetical protein